MSAISVSPTEGLDLNEQPLSAEELRKMDAYWRACNYLCVGMLYLRANPLLREPLKVEHIKNRLLGHWGSDPGQTFTWVHLNRLIKKYDLNLIYISGPGHGAPATLSNSYLEGVYSEVYPDKSQDVEGMQKFFKQFSFPGGIGSHCTPETPGSIHEGGELGYSLSHGFGAAFDNPDLIVTVVVGDGESETGPLATSWHGNKFLNPVRDGAVLPILHLNGYKIANPTILARIPPEELEMLFKGLGWKPYVVEGCDPAEMHQKMAATVEQCYVEIRAIQDGARSAGSEPRRPKWPMIILRTPKGWIVAGASDSDHRSGDESRAPADGGSVDAELQAGGTVRRERWADCRVGGDGAGWPAADYGESACERRSAAQAAGPPRLSRLCGEGGEAGASGTFVDGEFGGVSGRGDAAEHDQLPRVWAG